MIPRLRADQTFRNVGPSRVALPLLLTSRRSMTAMLVRKLTGSIRRRITQPGAGDAHGLAERIPRG